MVGFDASVLLFVFDENVKSSVPKAKERVEYLIDRLSKSGKSLFLPGLERVHGGCWPGRGGIYLTIIGKQSCFRVASFDERAAVEAAIRTFQARQRGQSKGGNPEAARAKIKFDRQIVAIATVEGATAVYSDDADVVAYAREVDMEAYRLSDLPEPPEDPQTALPFDQSDDDQ